MSELNVNHLFGIVTLLLLVVPDGVAAATRKNVLFLISDDMRPDIGAYAGRDSPTYVHPKMVTPNLDALAAKSLLLKRAYVQYSMCTPSRSSLLTGRRPDTTHVYELFDQFRIAGGNFTTIPQYFKQQGYASAGMGKIFFARNVSYFHEDPFSWTEPYYFPSNLEYWDVLNTSWTAVSQVERKVKPLPDEQLTEHAIDTIKRLAPQAKSGEKPFFIAVGFYKPHLPFVFPEEILSLYPLESIKVPENLHAPVNMPTIAWFNYTELRIYQDIAVKNYTGAINTVLDKKLIKQLRRAYYSALTWTDMQIGRVMDALKMHGVDNNTIVSFWGDHGWQLGEHGEWGKHTNFELATHAPMMIHIPGLSDKGVTTEKLTEFVDLFPTLAEAAGLPVVPQCPADSSKVSLCTEGTSLIPLIKNPNSTTWKAKAFSQFTRYIFHNGYHMNVMGYTMRTEHYRYTEWVRFLGPPSYKPDWDTVVGVELYDHVKDPQENWNRADEPGLANTRALLSGELHKGWRAAWTRI